MRRRSWCSASGLSLVRRERAIQALDALLLRFQRAGFREQLVHHQAQMLAIEIRRAPGVGAERFPVRAVIVRNEDLCH